MFDTSAYIAAIRGGVGSPASERLQNRLPRTYLASVVSAELRAGASTEDARRAVSHFTLWARRVGRLVTPSAASWDRAGDVLGQLRAREPGLRSKIPALWNDLWIALAARQVGATVVTANARDFEILRRYLRFDLEITADP
ncbi:MAG: type II toxin-antitoxin system VapC family toxin [Candidatus Rokuibacteriota bacterium]